MSDGANHRDQILLRIHSASGTPDSREASDAWLALSRPYNSSLPVSHPETIELFAERLHDYDASVYRVSIGQVAETIASILAALPSQAVLLAPGFPEDLLPHGPSFVPDIGLPPHELDRFHTVLTTSTIAIAQTGTIVLQNTVGQGRRAITLVPDTHLCVVRTSDVVQTVPQAVRLLQGTSTLPTTFVSGPSATADIEMTRIKGVHGPRFLHVLLVSEE